MILLMCIRQNSSFSVNPHDATKRCCYTVLFFGLVLFSNTALSIEIPRIRPDDYIRSVLFEQKSPLLKINWGAEVFFDTPLNDQPVGANPTLRKAKLRFYKDLGTNWDVTLNAKYSTSNKFEVSDNYFLYKGWRTATAKFGIFDPPFSLESYSSSSGLTFMERSLAVASLSERKSGGFGVTKRTPNSIINAGIYFFSPKNEGLSEQGKSFVLHYVHSPIRLQKAGNIHVGGSLSYRLDVDSANTQFRSLPEIGTVKDYYVDTGKIDGANKIARFSLEAGTVQGRFSWQAEALMATVKRKQLDDVFFWGAYAYLSWFLTEDQRNYSEGSGRFLAVTPNSPMFKGGHGAFEVALRASYVDLQDRDIFGGTSSSISLGLNWYLNSRYRCMVNLVKTLDVNRPGSEFDNLDPLSLSMRFQWSLN
jgi:phosphate-selective porin OprO/OprP